MSVAECGGEPADQRWVFSVTNSTLQNKATGTCVNVPGCKSEIVYDQCGKTGPSCGPFENANEMWTLTAAGQLQSGSSKSELECAELQHDKSVQLKRCASPITAEQTWKYDKTSQQLTSGGGMCVTASSPVSKIKQTTMVFGRPISGGAYAMLFLNDYNVSKSVTCNASCMENMLTLKPKSAVAIDSRSRAEVIAEAAGIYTVEEVWSGGKTLGDPITCTATGCGPVTVSVPAHGATTYVRLVPKKATTTN
jgi:hypothetical protein